MKETTNSEILIRSIIDCFLPLKVHIPLISFQNYCSDYIVVARTFLDLAEGTMALIIMAGCWRYLLDKGVLGNNDESAIVCC